MRLSVDYWDIKIEGVIEEMDPTVALNQCALNGHLCDLIHRGPGGSLWRNDESFIYAIQWNLGDQHYTGIDVAWAWSFKDHWKFNLIGTYFLKRETTYIPNEPDSSWDCAGKAGWDNVTYCPVTPKWRHIASLSYNSDSFWDITGRWRFYDGVTYFGNSEIAADALGAQNYLDMSAVMRFMDTHDFTFGINNILDEEPPLVGNAVDIQGYYDMLGRYLFAQFTFRW
jgi:outer membrane receptor protein involved in Fe transport